MIDTFLETITSSLSIPAPPHLFTVWDECEKLDDEKASTFHTITAKGLFACKRARGDIQTAIAFLTTRVLEPDLDDWKKLKRLIQYLYGTKDMILTLSADNMSIFKWYIDAAHTVHPDMKGHTGAVLIMGTGSIYNTSIKQKINTRSSTESELVGVDDVIPQVLWTRYFIQSQGYTNTDTVVYQDNKSAILLEKNGKLSSSKRTKHIQCRYFFIKDCIEREILSVEHCPTDDMVADYFTKPLQGMKFFKFRKMIMNL